MENSSTISFQLGNVTNANLEQLRIVHINTLPVRYSDKFYKDLLTTYSPEYMKLVFVNGFSVGAVCARVEETETKQTSIDDEHLIILDNSSKSGKKKLYIMTLGVLAAYRRYGLGKSYRDFTCVVGYVLQHLFRFNSFSSPKLRFGNGGERPYYY